MFSDTSNSENPHEVIKTSENKSSEPSNEFEVGDTAETDNFKISFISANDYASNNEFLQPKDGNKYIKCEFEFENISNTDQYVTLWDFKCYADSYSCEQTYLEDDTLSATLSNGKKTKGAVFFEIPQDSESVTLEYDTSFWSQNKIIFNVK